MDSAEVVTLAVLEVALVAVAAWLVGRRSRGEQPPEPRKVPLLVQSAMFRFAWRRGIQLAAAGRWRRAPLPDQVHDCSPAVVRPRRAISRPGPGRGRVAGRERVVAVAVAAVDRLRQRVALALRADQGYDRHRAYLKLLADGPLSKPRGSPASANDDARGIGMKRDIDQHLSRRSLDNA